MRSPITPATLDLLLLTKPLIDQHTTGKKREALQRAWMNSMRNEAATMLGLDDEGRLPAGPGAAGRLLLTECLQIAKANGMDGIELQQFFSTIADQGVMAAADPDLAIRRAYALLGILQAQHLAALLPDDDRRSA